MQLAPMLLAAVALALPGQVIAAPLCATLKSVLPVAKADKWMASLKTGEGEIGEWLAAKQIDGFKCVITKGTTPTMVRGFFNCTWTGTRETQPAAETIAAIGKCFAVAPRVEEKSYTTTTLFDLQASPRIWVAVNEFKSGKLSFSLIAE
jgi:hypothetical protein